MEIVKDKFKKIKNINPQLVVGECVFLTLKNSEIDIELLKLSKSSFAENQGLSIMLDLR